MRITAATARIMAARYEPGGRRTPSSVLASVALTGTALKPVGPRVAALCGFGLQLKSRASSFKKLQNPADRLS